MSSNEQILVRGRTTCAIRNAHAQLVRKAAAAGREGDWPVVWKFDSQNTVRYEFDAIESITISLSTDYTLCFETPFSTAGGVGGASSVPRPGPAGGLSSHTVAGKTAPKAADVFPMLQPCSTPLGNSFTTPVFRTPASSTRSNAATPGSSSRRGSCASAESSFLTPGIYTCIIMYVHVYMSALSAQPQVC